LKVLEGNRVRVYNEKGELIQEREATLEDLKELREQYIDSKFRELLTQYEIEITIDPKSFKGIGRFKKRS
jgi:aspartokinase-like uncharacterized kinase